MAKLYSLACFKDQLMYFTFISSAMKFCWLVISRCGEAQWLSGGVLDSRLRDCGFEPHQRHFILSLSKTHYPLLNTGLEISEKVHLPCITKTIGIYGKKIDFH